MRRFRRKKEKPTMANDVLLVRETVDVTDKVQFLHDLLFTWMPSYTRGLVNEHLQRIKSLRQDEYSPDRDEKIHSFIEDILQDIEANNTTL